tara:strand:+ start:36 stop:1496 length:1461 start_codon:yes stop_codon:yes gene_type:complete
MGNLFGKQKAPDYRGAARETAAGNLANLREQTKLNRVNQKTPFGDMLWHGTQGQPGYGQELRLTPNQQAIFDAQEEQQFQRQSAGAGLTDRMWGDMQRPDNYYDNLPEVAGTPNVPTYGNGLGQYGQLDQLGDYGQLSQLQNQGRLGMLSEWGNMPDPDASGIGQNLGPEGQAAGVQDRMGAGGQSGYDPRFAQQAFDRQMSLVSPRQEQNLESLEVSLRNQGLTPGSEAYDRAMTDLRNQQGEETNRLSADAVGIGRAEQQAEFGRGMQNNQFDLSAGGQRFGQEAQRAQFLDQQRAARMAEQSGAFDARLNAASWMNDKRGLQNQEQLARAGFLDAQRSRQNQEQLGRAGFYDDQRAQMNQEQLGRAGFYNDQRQQQAQEQLGFGGQAFTQQMQGAEFQNMLRQRAIAEQRGIETSSLNLMNAAQNGQQVGMPQMPGYNTAGYVGGPDMLGAAKMQGDLDAANYATSMGPVTALAGSMNFGKGG